MVTLDEYKSKSAGNMYGSITTLFLGVACTNVLKHPTQLAVDEN